MKRFGFASFILLVSLPCAVMSLEATQTDWSGGGGVEGPVTDWGDTFDSAVDTDWLRSPGDLALGRMTVEHTVDDAFDDAFGVYVADIDGDTDLDIVGAAASSAGEVVWWSNDDGAGGSWTKHTISDTFTGAQRVIAADLDGDTDLDIIASGAPPFSGRVYWWENDGSGGGWTPHVISEYYPDAWEVSAADVDGDTDLDVICASSCNEYLTWWSNDDGVGGSWTGHTVDSSLESGYIAALGIDMDGDLDIDIVGGAWEANTVVWWENTDGSGTNWTENIVSEAVAKVWSVCAVDLDGDNDLDLVATAFQDGTVLWWENVDGSGTSWTEGVVATEFGSPVSVFAADMDADTDADILCASVYGNEIAWWENDGSGGGWTEHPVAAEFNLAWDAYAEDLDGDSMMDVVGASRGNDKIAWWSFSAYTSSGDLTSSILDITDEDEWGWILWDADTPTGTEVGLSLRASDDSGHMGSWSDVAWGADLGDTYPSMYGYLQYRVGLSTTDSQVSPIFSSVDFYTYFHLVSPENGAVVGTLTPTLDWDDTVIPAFDTYTLWWGTDPDFGDYNEVASIVDSTHRITSGIEDGDVIYWRVKALDSSSNEFWAPEQNWSFTVDLGSVVELVYMEAGTVDEGVLVSWAFEGAVPAGIRVLREVGDSITPLHAAPLSGDSRRYLDRDVSPDVEYSYWLEIIEEGGIVSRFGPTEAVSIQPEALTFGIENPYPQPADDHINLRYTLVGDGHVQLAVYDLAGRRVATLVDSDMTPGRHEVSWDCSDVPNGVYLYRLTAEGKSASDRLVIGR